MLDFTPSVPASQTVLFALLVSHPTGFQAARCLVAPGAIAAGNVRFWYTTTRRCFCLMNYLSHHALARRIRPGGDGDFFAGNLLPDLLSASGDGRIRTAGDHAGAVADGVRLHIATDKIFHGATAFHAAQSEADALIRAAPWETSPRRRFFVAHVLVELALDAHLLGESPELPDDLYRVLAASLRGDLIARAETLAGQPVPNLRGSIERFLAAGFLRDYATPAGLARSLTRVCRRAGVPNFESPADKETLAGVFEAFAPHVAGGMTDLVRTAPIAP